MGPEQHKQHDEADIAAEITLNYERMLQARADGSSEALQLTFEQRMNAGLERYRDLVRASGRTALDAA